MIVLASNKYKPHFGGIENSLYFLSKEYKNLNHKVVILADDRSMTKYKRLPHYELEEDVVVLRYKSYFPKYFLDHLIKPFVDVARAKKVFEKLNRENECVEVLGRHPIPVLAALLANLKVNYLVPGIVKTQMKIQKKSKFDFKAVLINKLVIRFTSYQQVLALRKATNVLAFSNNMKNQIHNFVGNNIPVKLVNAGVDSNRFKPDSNMKKSNLIGVKDDCFVFLTVGRLIKDKGIDYAIESFAKVKNKNSILIVVGEGIEKENLIKLANDRGVFDRVYFVGKILDGMEKYYQVADCFLMSSVMEPFGQTILEALATGLPIIAWKSSETIKTATSEIIDENNGQIIDFGIENMTNAMNHLLGLDDKNYQRLKNNNIELINNNYSWKSLALRNLEL